ncbi:MAG: hypothetical protein H6719_29295 [Sandaracinaceae bacterium]|nr:hypothetical protein [Sandaracinaceae bacterium]
MKPLDLNGEQAPHALAALRSVALADGRIAEQEAQMLAVHAELLGFDGDLDALPPLDLDALAERLPDPAHRAALVQRLVLMAMLDGEVGREEIAQTRAIARRLGVLQPAIDQMEHFLAGRMRLLAFDVMRRSFIAEKIGRVWRDEGLRGVAKVARQARGKADPALAARYLALEALPEGTLGRALFEHFRRHGFALPGEEKSAPEAVLFHDLGHVLAGYGTDPEGEVQMAGFEAGFMGEDGFSVTVLALYLFHLGADLNLSAKPSRLRFALEPFRAAFARGAALNVDLRDWDPWPHMSEPLDEVRAQLRVS